MILVTGGNGFIGRSVCAVLRASGRSVVAVDRVGAPESQEVFSYSADINDRRELEIIFKAHRFGCVIHLAALLPTASRSDPEECTRVNILGSQSVLETAVKFGVPRVVYASSASVYGTRPPQEIATEGGPVTPVELYGAAKRYVEILGGSYRGRGVEFVALRVATVVGVGSGSKTSAWRSAIFEKLGQLERDEVYIPYRPEEAMPLLHVEDAARMFAAVAEAKAVAFPVYNTPCESWSFADLRTAIERTDRHLLVALGHERVTGLPRAVNGERFLQEFGVSPVPLKERLRSAVQPTAQAIR